MAAFVLNGVLLFAVRILSCPSIPSVGRVACAAAWCRLIFVSAAVDSLVFLACFHSIRLLVAGLSGRSHILGRQASRGKTKPTPAPSRAFAVLLLPVLLPLLTNPLDIRSHCRMVSRLMSYRFTSSRSTSYTASDSRALDNGDEQWTPPSLPLGVPPASCTIIRTVDGTLLAASCTYTSSPSVSSS
uniref:Putative secreted protein n=1 Tax=Anopheles darlingi TaxID=43151 RepID=A0A2M4DAI9_ANODA